MASKRQIEANRANSEEDRAANKRRQSSMEPQRLSEWLISLGRTCRFWFRWFDAVLAEDCKGTDMAVAVQDLAQARSRQDRLRALRLILILAMIEGAEPKRRYLSSLERYAKAALSRQRRGLKHLKRNAG
ncbi:hypothetical protein BSZ21_06770 [Bradyrhizobium canariense]|nr:hypothetical protein BSZ21_06770 [Bradyrhizobium canariense]